jgi:hypothetical protein
LLATLLLGLALDEKASTVTAGHLKRAALPKDKPDVEPKTSLLGEEDFARAEPEKADDALLASFGFSGLPIVDNGTGGSIQDERDLRIKGFCSAQAEETSRTAESP